jgi:hypothetical protein
LPGILAWQIGPVQGAPNPANFWRVDDVRPGA